MTRSRPLRSAGSAAAACASVRKVRGLGVVETVIGRLDDVMRCIATDLEPAAVESADMDSRGMVVELAMPDSPAFAVGDEVAVAQHVELESARASGGFKQRKRAPGLCEHRRSCAAADQLRGFDLSLLAGMASSIMAHIGAGRWIVRPIAQGTVAVTQAQGV